MTCTRRMQLPAAPLALGCGTSGGSNYSLHVGVLGKWAEPP